MNGVGLSRGAECFGLLLCLFKSVLDSLSNFVKVSRWSIGEECLIILLNLVLVASISKFLRTVDDFPVNLETSNTIISHKIRDTVN